MTEKRIHCERAGGQLTDWLAGQLPEAERAELDAHLMHCPACQQELQVMQQLWQGMGQIPVPEPRESMRIRFDAMLDTYRETATAEPKNQLARVWTKLGQWLGPQPARQLAFGLLLLVVGVGAGYWFRGEGSPDVAYRQQMDTLSTQVQEMRQMMLLSLLENPSASERLRAVSYTNEINGADKQVVDALLTTLNNDPNVNVRLVTLEALANLADDARVREGLVQSITRQESPLVQSALADVMVKLQEKRSIKPLQQLLRQKNLHDVVKSKIQRTVNELS